MIKRVEDFRLEPGTEEDAARFRAEHPELAAAIDRIRARKATATDLVAAIAAQPQDDQDREDAITQLRNAGALGGAL